MVQFFLILTSLLAPAYGKSKPTAKSVPAIEMDGGRMLLFERMFTSEREVRAKRGFWNKLVDIAIGEPQFHTLMRPYSVALDSRGRVIVTDPAVGGVHIFDFAEGKYRFISRREAKEPMKVPQCVAVDREDNIYITDPEEGKIFVFSLNGKFLKTIGSLKGGEGFFKRPTGIAVDRESGEIYVTDTWRHKVYVLDAQGNVEKTIGKNGRDPGEFNYPTEVKLAGKDVLVVDSMNFRVQVFDRAGGFRYALTDLFRAKGIAVDSEGHIYVGDGITNRVQVFDEQGRLLYYFGGQGRGAEQFQMVDGLAIDPSDRIYVVDSFNRRMQVLHYYGPGKYSQAKMK